MTSSDKKIDVRVYPAKAWDIQTTEDKQAALIFQFEDDSMEGVLVPRETYSAFATRILKEAQKFAIEAEVKSTGSEVVQVDPIQVPSIGLGVGRTESEAILAMDVGNLKLAFAVELSALAGLCMSLSRMTKNGARSNEELKGSRIGYPLVQVGCGRQLTSSRKEAS